MKLLSWFINIQGRYYRQARAYNKRGILYRVFCFLLLTILVGGAVVLEYVSLNMVINQGNAVGIILAIIAVLLLLPFLEMCGVYSFFGFKNSASGALTGWIEKAEAKRNAKKNKQKEISAAPTAEENQVVAQDEQAETSKRKCPRWLDLCLGIYFLVLAVAGFVMACAVVGMVV